MLWSQSYARYNRELIAIAALNDLFLLVGSGEEVQRVNCHHNYSVREEHFGRRMWVTRKGAIRAGVGYLGVIPGSMGTRSYIVEGLGNVDSYCSCSHGAGRRLSRTQAKKQLTAESLTEAMQGKAWNKDPHLLDEHPLAYKDIDRVMADQQDLVKVVHTLHQVVNYKGL
mgnify:CR=1 FL=1